MKKVVSILLFMALGTLILLGQARMITGTVSGAEDGSALPGVTVTVKGTTENPRVGLDLNSAKTQIASQLKQTVKNEAEKKKKELEKQARDELEAKKKAEEDKIKAELEKKKKEAEEELKDKVKGLFGK